MTEDQCRGCLLGLALGDALGAPYEGAPTSDRRLGGKALGIRRDQRGVLRWTDDTQMALDIAESLAECGGLDQDRLAQRFAASFCPTRGYGGGAARLLSLIGAGEDWRKANRAVFPDGSFGNGAAMRAPVLGVYFQQREERIAAARQTAEITHAHPLGIEGAVLIAEAAHCALLGEPALDAVKHVREVCEQQPFVQRLELVRTWMSGGDHPNPGELARVLGNGIEAVEAAPAAAYIGLRFGEAAFEDLMACVIDVGGDVDTIGAMAGGIWGARNGASRLPLDAVRRLEQIDRLEKAAMALYP